MTYSNSQYINISYIMNHPDYLFLDWEAKSMYLQLCILSLQQKINNENGFILDNDHYICKILNLNDLQKSNWLNHLKNQIFKNWTRIYQSEQNEYYWKISNSFKDNLFTFSQINTDIKSKKTINKTISKDNTNKKNIKNKINTIENHDFFEIKNLIIESPYKTILYESKNSEESHTIWTFGISFLNGYDDNPQKNRAFIAKMIKQFSEKQVAIALTEASLKKPVDAYSFIIGILKAKQKLENEKNSYHQTPTGLVL